ncbi:MAG TPA: hypothetical protein VGL91_17390 [Acidobacteriota bacterium]|jgi:hypothetical protein
MTNPGVSRERRDVNIRGILIFGVALLACTIVIYLILWGLLRHFEVQTQRLEAKAPPLARERQQVPPEPRLQGAPRHENSPSMDIERFRAQEDQLLNSYGWVDSKAGVVRIPIEDAKKLLLQRGLPVREQAGEGRK